jgi:biotin carboxyl carrier protein
VRIFDERREAAPKAPAGHGGHGGEHVHGEIRAPMQGTIVKVLVEKVRRSAPARSSASSRP